MTLTFLLYLTPTKVPSSILLGDLYTISVAALLSNAFDVLPVGESFLLVINVVINLFGFIIELTTPDKLSPINLINGTICWTPTSAYSVWST